MGPTFHTLAGFDVQYCRGYSVCIVKKCNRVVYIAVYVRHRTRNGNCRRRHNSCRIITSVKERAFHDTGGQLLHIGFLIYIILGANNIPGVRFGQLEIIHVLECSANDSGSISCHVVCARKSKILPVSR